MLYAVSRFRPAYNVQTAIAGSELGGHRTVVGVRVTFLVRGLRKVTNLVLLGTIAHDLLQHAPSSLARDTSVAVPRRRRRRLRQRRLAEGLYYIEVFGFVDATVNGHTIWFSLTGGTAVDAGV